MRTPGLPALLLALAALTAAPTVGQSASATGTSQETPATAGTSQDAALERPYVEGAAYSGDARIALDDAGHLLSVQAGTGRLADYGEERLFVVLATISGPATDWAFRFGAKDSTFTLLADGKRYAAIDAPFAAPVVAKLAAGAQPVRSRRREGTGTIVADTTEHPLAILFRLPRRALDAPEKTLSFRAMTVNSKNLTFDLLFGK